MAGINLSGAIGMTGKRESVLSDLPAITQNVGDSIVKSMQINKENKAKAAQLLEQQRQKEQAEQMDGFRKHLSIQFKDLDPNLSSGFKDDAFKEADNFYKTWQDPKATPAQKEQARLESMAKIQEYHNLYKKHEDDLDKHIKRRENDIYNTEDADKLLAGIDQDVEETLPNDLMHQPNTMNRNDIVSRKDGGDSKLVEKQVRDNFFKLPMDERRKIAPNGLDETLSNKTKLARVSPSDAIDKILPKVKWDAVVKEDNKDGNLSFAIDEEQLKANEDAYVYAIVNGQTKEGRILNQYFTIEAFKELAERNQNLTPSQRAKALEIGLEAKARASFQPEADARIKGLVNDRKSKTLKDVKQSGTNSSNFNTKFAATPEEKVVVQTNTYDDEKDALKERIAFNKQIIQEGKHKLGGEVKPINEKEKQNYIKVTSDYEKKLNDLENKSNVTIVGTPTWSYLTTGKEVEFKVGDKTIKGGILAPAIGEDGNIYLEVEEEVEKGVSRQKVKVKHLVPLTIYNRQKAINAAGDAKNNLEKQIVATEKEVEEYKKKKNIVSSQPKKEATKTTWKYNGQDYTEQELLDGGWTIEQINKHAKKVK